MKKRPFTKKSYNILIMDFDLLLKNPKEFITNLAQTTDEMPDLGMKKQIDSFLEENPDSIDLIPIVATSGHLQMSVPGSLIRLRCIIVQNITMEYLPLRVAHGGKYYTPIFQQDIPIDAEIPNKRTFGSRLNILVSSIPNISSWLINEIRPDIDVKSEPCNDMHESSSADPSILLEAPFQLNAKFLYDQSDKPCLLCDLIGFVDDPESFEHDLNTEFGEDAFYASIPSFIALTTIPIQSLYNPIIPSPEPSINDIRDQLMGFLTEFFEPPQAELLLLWMVGSVRARKDLILLGVFSLNLFEVEPQVAKLIIELFKFILTSVTDINLSVDEFNSRTLRPSIEHSELKSTPLMAACDTRLIINETELDEGKFDLVGMENIRILKKLIGQQAVDYYCEGDIFEMPVSYPTLILSQSRSILSDPLFPIQAYVPIGSVNQKEIDVDPSIIKLIRRYVENIRYCDFDINDEDTEIASGKLSEIIKSYRLEHSDYHFFMILNKLNCISHGSDSITDEYWDQACELFKATLPYQKKL